MMLSGGHFELNKKLQENVPKELNNNANFIILS